MTDLDWDPSTKHCLISCSADQTTRILSQYKSKEAGEREAEVDGNELYYEISRPQVHGYDINCITTLQNQDYQKDNNKEFILPFKILSGGDEKVIRLFEAPYNFVKAYNSLKPNATNED